VLYMKRALRAGRRKEKEEGEMAGGDRFVTIVENKMNTSGLSALFYAFRCPRIGTAQPPTASLMRTRTITASF